MEKAKIIHASVLLISLVFLGSGCQSKSARAKNDQQAAIKQEIKTIKKQASKANQVYFKHEETQTGTIEGISFIDTDNFKALNKEGDATIAGVTSTLKAVPDGYRPMTMADVLVTKVYKGDAGLLGKHVPILFQGGNITAGALGEAVGHKVINGKPMPESNLAPSAIVHVEYANRKLPHVGEAFIAILNKAEKGTNNIDQAYWDLLDGGDTIFWQNANGDYQVQVSDESDSVGGGGGQAPANYQTIKDRQSQLNADLKAYIKDK